MVEEHGIAMPSEPPIPQHLALPLEFHTPESIITRVANQVTTQIAPGGVYLSFYEAMVPLLLGDPDTVKAKLAETRSIRAECVARVFVPTDRFAEIVSAIQAILPIVGTLAGSSSSEAGGPQ
jgi:hypothetical protein